MQRLLQTSLSSIKIVVGITCNGKGLLLTNKRNKASTSTRLTTVIKAQHCKLSVLLVYNDGMCSTTSESDDDGLHILVETFKNKVVAMNTEKSV